MYSSSFRGARARRHLLACAALATLASQFVGAQVAPDSVVLDDVVVSATRTPVETGKTGSSVTVITSAELERRQIHNLTTALGGAAGAPIQTGATGGTTSLFMRGAESDHTLFIVDGIRFNDATSSYFNTLGVSGVSSFDTIEVLRGPQSTLYGADAIGGVVSIGSARGSGAPSTVVSGEAGSFGTVSGRLSTQGERDAWAYTASASVLRTDNDRDNNQFERFSLSSRVDYTVSETLVVGGTVRGVQSAYGSPGDDSINDPNNEDREGNWLGTLFAEITPNDDWSARLTLGAQYRRMVSDNPAPNPDPFAVDSLLSSSRYVLDAQTSYTGFEGHRLTGGFTLEQMEIRGDLSPNDTAVSKAFFLQDEYTPVERLTLTAGLRVDEFDSFGTQATGRGTVAWQVVPKTLKARASYGTGFRAPNTFELYGPAGWGSNPNLDPERARGGDIGLDWYVGDGRGVLSATYFETRYKDMIAGFPLVNVNEARTRGVELSASGRIAGSLQGSASYTYLDAEDESGSQRLARRPRHTATVDIWNDFGGGVSAGAGVTAVIDMVDVDAVTFGRIDGEDYVVARVYAAWQVNDRLKLKARVENLFDEDYSAVNGFPSLGIGAFAGAEWRF